MKIRYIGVQDTLAFLRDKVYDVIAIEKAGFA